jgi:hypothetical protein
MPRARGAGKFIRQRKFREEGDVDPCDPCGRVGLGRSGRPLRRSRPIASLARPGAPSKRGILTA